MSTALWVLVAGNAALMVWLWVHGGNCSRRPHHRRAPHEPRPDHRPARRRTRRWSRCAARPPASGLERLTGFDRLTVWHRWNGHACLDLILAHVVFSVWGYALMDRITVAERIRTMIGGGVYPGMITATVGTALFLAVVGTSVVIVRRRLRYEAWITLLFGVVWSPLVIDITFKGDRRTPNGERDRGQGRPADQLRRHRGRAGRDPRALLPESRSSSTRREPTDLRPHADPGARSGHRRVAHARQGPRSVLVAR